MSKNYKELSLYKLINESVPALSRIEIAMKEAPPDFLSDMLLKEPETTFIVDYYFRLFAPQIGAGFINHEDFDIKAAAELYNCQIIRFYRSHLYSTEYDFNYSSLKDSFWSLVKSDRLLDILELLISGSNSINASALFLLQNLDITTLEYLQEGDRLKSRAMLELFKKVGEGILGVITNNLDLFDFIKTLAEKYGDSDFLEFLDEYTRFIVQLRVAQALVEDGKNFVGEEGKIPFRDLVDMLAIIPDQALEVTLDMMLQKHYIDLSTKESIIELRNQ